jgi:hypothetical protein
MTVATFTLVLLAFSVGSWASSVPVYVANGVLDSDVNIFLADGTLLAELRNGQNQIVQLPATGETVDLLAKPTDGSLPWGKAQVRLNQGDQYVVYTFGSMRSSTAFPLQLSSIRVGPPHEANEAGIGFINLATASGTLRFDLSSPAHSRQAYCFFGSQWVRFRSELFLT